MREVDFTSLQTSPAVSPPAATQSGPDSSGSDSSGGSGTSFRDVLSALNPLQYMPVVGTIYRAVTGDVVAEPLRQIGSLVGSFLFGGPVGAMTGIASLILQKVTGIDTEQIGQTVLAGLGLGSSTVKAPSAMAGEAAAPAMAAARLADPAPARTAWTPGQLSAYGIGGTPPLSNTETLNSMELADIGRALAAYGRVQG